MRRTDDLHVEPVGSMPPIVERRRGEHGDAAPRRNERAQRSAESPQRDRALAQRRFAMERGGEDQVPAGQARQYSAQVDVDMRRCPEGVTADGAMPGYVP